MLNILTPVKINTDSGIKIFFLDFIDGKLYNLDGTDAGEEVTKSVIEDVQQQQESMMPNIPYEDIYEVMSTEKKISQENDKHIFRRQ